MSEPHDATVDAGALPEPGSSDVTSFTGEPVLRIGARWRSLVIESEVPGESGCFIANHVGLMENVQVGVSPFEEGHAWRSLAWEKLAQLNDPRLVRCVEAHEENGQRYEITAVPPPMTLREWMAAHRPSPADVESLIRQVGGALAILHEAGLVHLDLRPEAIHIDDSHGEPVFVLGRLQHVTLHAQPELVVAEVNPLYAPPEAAGLTKHPPGERLCAWDWWSLGRVVQEFLLGKHVLSVVLDRDVTRDTPEVRHRAEQLLLEREPPGVKPGALEFMTLEPGSAALLRGLLTSSPDARWGWDAVQRWLAREAVRDHYELPRTARMWRWRGRALTLAEAAEFFTRRENWDTGEDMLFHPHEPETLAHFLNEVPAHRDDWERLQAVCDLAESSAWEKLPVVARRTVTAAVAWLTLAAGTGGKATFRVRGQAIDATGFAELLKADGVDTGVMLATAILTPAVVQAVEPFDAAASRLLKTVAARGGVALERAVEHGWVDADDPPAHARMLELSLPSAAVLRERVDLLRATHATNTDATLAELLANKSPEPAEWVILAFTADAPERHGYITHENWRRQQCAALQESASGLVRQLFWLRLHSLLRAAPLWGAKSRTFSTIALGATVAAGLWTRSAAAAVLVPAALLGSRLWLWWRVQRMARRFDGTGAPWTWHDGQERTTREVTRIRESTTQTAAELADELEQLRAKLADLATATVRPSPVVEPKWWDAWAAIVLAAAVCVGAVVYPWVAPATEERAVEIPATPEGVALPEVPERDAVSDDDAETEPVLTPAELIATGRYEVVDDGFGRRLRGPLQPWTFRPPAKVERLEIAAAAPAKPEQTAFALVSGAVLLRPYARNAVSVYLAVKVPTTRGFGIMIFNTRDRELLHRDVLLVSHPLAERTWYELEGRRVFYLGRALPPDAEISLAPP